MNKFFAAFLLILSLCCKNAATYAEEFDVSKKIENTEKGFRERWNNFAKGQRDFYLWSPNWKQEDLKIRFDNLFKERNELYLVNPEVFGKEGKTVHWKEAYQMPKNWEVFYSRFDYPNAFQYALAYPNYNANIISLHGMRFLAMEAPTEKNLNLFFKILNVYKVTDLVRLTPAFYEGREGSVPYWEGRMNIHSINGRTAIEIADREINYFPTDCWRDRQGVGPKKLFALIKAVKNSTVSDPKMIAVHCRAGIGRTGTFLAAYLLINEIDQQIANGVAIDKLKISIDKAIWEFSLQRPLAVTHFSQYLTLYQLVDYYTELLKSRKTFS
jgi:protein tyrosine phosphatase